MSWMPPARYACLLLALTTRPLFAAEPFPGTSGTLPGMSPVEPSGPFGNTGGSGGMCLVSGTGNPGGGQCDTPPGAVPSGQPAAAVGNPLNVMNGNKFQAETDLPALPGALGLQLSRSYNSQSRSRGVFGQGWRHAYEVSLYENARSVQLIQADGRRLIFSKDADGNCRSASPRDGRIERLARGWRWTWVNGRSLDFEASPADPARGRLITLRDNQSPGRPFVSLRYGLRDELVTVRDPFGRTLNFSYARYGDRQWPEVRVTTPVGVYRYRLDGDGNLLTVHRADGAQIGYYYEAARQGGDIHNLTGRAIWQSDTRQWRRVATWAYDTQDRAILSEHAGGVERVSLQFDDRPKAALPGSPARGPEFETVLNNSLGQQTRYRWQLLGQEWRLLESRGAGCASCGPVNRRYGYDAAGRVVREEGLSRAGQVLNWQTYQLDAQGRLRQRVSGAAGAAEQAERYNYERTDLPWQPTAVRRPSVWPGREAVTRYTYNAQGRPLTVTESGFTPTGQPLLRQRSYAYDPDGRLLSEDGPLPNLADGRGDITRFQYDREGRLSGLTGVGGRRVTVTARDPLGRVAVLTLREGSRRQQWRLAYDARGGLHRLTREAEGMAVREQVFERDSDGQVQRMRDAAGLWTRFERDAAGRLRLTVLPDGQRLTLTHDTEGRITRLSRATDDAGVYQQLDWQYEDDATGAVQRLRDGEGLIRESHMLPDGRSRLDRDALGRERRSLYDGRGDWQAGQLAAFGVSLPPEWRVREAGRITQGGSGLQAVTLRDDWGRVTLQRLPGQGLRLFRHDAADNPVALATEDGTVRRFRYDYAGHRIAEGDATRPDAVVTHFDGDLPVIKRSDREERRWTYNAFGERIGEERRDTGADGQRQTWTQVWTYDAAGRPVLETRGDLHLAYVYGKDGRLTAVRSAEGRGSGWLAAVFGGGAPGIWSPVADDIRYDAWGRIQRMTLRHGTRQDFQRDGRGRVTGITTHRHTTSVPTLIEFFQAWLPDDWVWSTAVRLGMASLKTETHHYRYDAVNRLTQRQEGRLQERFRYDPAGRLSGVDTLTNGAWRETGAYAYDGHGNRRLEQQPEQLVRYHYAPDGVQWLGRDMAPRHGKPAPALLTQLAGYDTLGRPGLWWQGVIDPVQGISLAGLQKEHAPLWRLQLAGSQPAAWTDEQGKTPLRYGYDLDGLPAWQHWQAPGAGYWRREARYQGALRVRETDAWTEGGKHAAQRVQRDYVYVGQWPVAVRVDGGSGSGSGWGEVLANRSGAPLAVLDGVGQVRWETGYEPFGGRRDTVEDGRGWAVSLRLPGQHEDPVTGFYQNGFRTYVPWAGRYLTPDPAGLRGGLNPFVYVGNDPLNAVDPWGLYQIDMHYYMTYFLGIVTGFSADQARKIALATQFVDENDYTVPLRDGGIPLISTVVDGIHNATDDRLAFYHFVNTREGWTNTLEAGSYDPVRNRGESQEDYRIRRLTANVDSIAQIQNLEFNYRNVSGCSQKLQFFGEFLHAFEDTFAHRDKNNDPFGLNGGTGHATGGENPDYTPESVT